MEKCKSCCNTVINTVMGKLCYCIRDRVSMDIDVHIYGSCSKVKEDSKYYSEVLMKLISDKLINN